MDLAESVRELQDKLGYANGTKVCLDHHANHGSRHTEATFPESRSTDLDTNPAQMNREAQRSLGAIPGKTIAHVIAAEGRSVPAQLFLVFTDGTYCELYSECSIDAGPRLYEGDRAVVRKLTQGNQKIVFDTGDRSR